MNFTLPIPVILFYVCFVIVLFVALVHALIRATGEQRELRRRCAHLEQAYSDVLLKYFNDETGPRFEQAPDWTPADAGNLSTFLKTETGQTLARRFAVVAGIAAVAGCADSMHTAHSAGSGNGWNEACQWFLKLSRVVGDQTTKNDEQAPEDEAQLLERLSS